MTLQQNIGSRGCGAMGPRDKREDDTDGCEWEGDFMVPSGGTVAPRIRDELYIIELCDQVLGVAASRQHRFPFLRGDPDRRGACRALPVDAYYDAFKLVIEYSERQHVERVQFWDRKKTLSGVSRGEQRRLYDERRHVVLPQNGITLIELNFTMFAHNVRKRLHRNRAADEAVIRVQLIRIIENAPPAKPE